MPADKPEKQILILYAMTRGISRLCKKYDNQAIDSACRRALSYGALSYLKVKNILEKKLYDLPGEDILQVY